MFVVEKGRDVLTKGFLYPCFSFYSEEPPAFVEAMSRALKASGERIRRLPGTSMFYRSADRQYEEDVKLQHQIADDVSRRSSWSS
jgi:hypothetical protein